MARWHIDEFSKPGGGLAGSEVSKSEIFAVNEQRETVAAIWLHLRLSPGKAKCPQINRFRVRF
jgi:hypothetical protein